MHDAEKEERQDSEVLRRAFAVIIVGVIGAAAFATAVGIWKAGSKVANASAHETRWLASQEGPAHHHHGNGVHAAQKPRGPLAATLTTDLDESAKGPTEFRIRGSIDTHINASELHYKFTLPSGLKLKKGSAEGTLYGVEAGESPEIDLVVVSDGTPSGRIHFRVWKVEGKSSLAATARLRLGAEESGLTTMGTKSRPQPKAPRSVEEFRERAIH